jgi:voltage-gated potassium channel
VYQPSPRGGEPLLGSESDAVRRLVFLILGQTANVRWLIAGTLAISFLCAAVVQILARNDFPSFGVALWWAVQTVTTVGYGDVVPQPGGARGVAAILMVVGVAFTSVLTATVTAGLVDRRRRERRADPVLDALERIEARLDALEKR